MQAAQLKILTDKHIPKAIVEQLRRRGVDVERVEDIGMDASADEDILEYATANGRSVLSFNYDFDRLHKAWLDAGQQHAGVFRAGSHLQGDKGIGRIVTFIGEYFEMVNVGAASLADDVYNQMVYIN